MGDSVIELHQKWRRTMSAVPSGTVLTCAHEGCECRIRVESECHCEGPESSYKCTCGADMVPVTE